MRPTTRASGFVVFGLTQLDEEENTCFARALQASVEPLSQKKALKARGEWTQDQARQQFLALDALAQNGITGKQAVWMAIIRATGHAFRERRNLVWCTPVGTKPTVEQCASADGWCRFWTPTQGARKDARKPGGPSQWAGGAQWILSIFDLHRRRVFEQRERDGSTTQHEATWAEELTGDGWWRVKSATGVKNDAAILMPALGLEIDDGTRQQQVDSIINLARHFRHAPTVVDSGGKSYHVFAPLAQPVDLLDPEQEAKRKNALILLNGVIGGDYACMDARHEFRLPSFYFEGAQREQPTIFLGRAPCFDNIDDALERATKAYCEKYHCTPESALADAIVRKGHSQTRKQIDDAAKKLREKIAAGAQIEATAIAEAHRVLQLVDALAGREWKTTQAEIDELVEIRTALYRVSANRTEHSMLGPRRGRAKTACKLATSGDVPRHIRRYLEKCVAVLAETPKGQRDQVANTYAFQIGQRLRDAGETTVQSGILDALQEACKLNGWADDFASPEALRATILQSVSSGMAGAPRDPNGTDADGVARIDGVRYMHARFFDKVIEGGRVLKTLDPEQPLSAVTIVTGGCGIGKSEMCLAHVRKMPKDARIVVIFPRKSLITENLDKYQPEGFESYLNPDGTVRRDLSAVSRVLICVDSLRKIEGLPFDLAIIDEAASDLLACTKIDTAADQYVTQRLFDSFCVLRALMQGACTPAPEGHDDRLCKQVILCSAVINRPIMQAIKHLCGAYEPLVLTMPEDVKPYAGKRICEISEKDFWPYYLTARISGLRPFVGELTKKGVESISFGDRVLTRNAQTKQSSLQCTSTARLVGRIRDAWSGQDAVFANLAAHVGLSDTDPAKKVAFVLTGAYGFNLAKPTDRAMPATFETFLQIANRIRTAEWIFIVTQDGTPDGVQWLPPTQYEHEERQDFETMRKRTSASAEMPDEDDVRWFCRLRALVRESVDADKFHCVSRLMRYFTAQGAQRTQPPALYPFTPEMHRIMKALDIRSPKNFPRSKDVARALKQGAISAGNRAFLEDWIAACYPDQNPIDDMRQRIARRGDKAEVHLEDHAELWARILLHCAGYASDVEREEAIASCQSHSQTLNPLKRGTLRQKCLALLELLQILTANQLQPIDGGELSNDELATPYDFGSRLARCFNVSRTNIAIDRAQRLCVRRFAVPPLDSVTVNSILSRYHGRAIDSPEYTVRTSEQLTRRIFEIVRDASHGAINTTGRAGRVVIDGRKVTTFAIDEPRLFEWFAELQDGVSRFFDKTREQVIDPADVRVLDVDPGVVAKIEADESALSEASTTFAEAFDHPERFAPALDTWTGSGSLLSLDAPREDKGTTDAAADTAAPQVESTREARALIRAALFDLALEDKRIMSTALARAESSGMEDLSEPLRGELFDMALENDALMESALARVASTRPRPPQTPQSITLDGETRELCLTPQQWERWNECRAHARQLEPREARWSDQLAVALCALSAAIANPSRDQSETARKALAALDPDMLASCDQLTWCASSCVRIAGRLLQTLPEYSADALAILAQIKVWMLLTLAEFVDFERRLQLEKARDLDNWRNWRDDDDDEEDDDEDEEDDDDRDKWMFWENEEGDY